MAIWSCHTICLSQKTIPDLKTDLVLTTSARLKADICFEIADSYTNSLKIDSALYFADKIKEYSQQSNYETGIGKYHLAFAWAIFYRSRNDETEENAAKAIEIFTRQKEVMLSGRAYLTLANSQYVTNKIQLARKNYWTAIAIFKPGQNARGLYPAYWWMARSYFKTSVIDSASFYYINALSMAEQLNDADKIFQAGCWVGRTFLSLGEPRKAISYFERGLKHRSARTDKVGLRSFLSDYATCLVLTHEFSKLDSVLKEVESVNAQLKDGYGNAVVTRLKGNLEYETKNYPQAVSYLKQAYNKMNELKISNSETKDIVLLLGKAEYEIHEYDSVVVHLKSAILMSKESRSLIDEAEAHLLLSRVFQQRGNPDSALYYFTNYSLLKDSTLSQQKQKNIIEVTARYETEKKEQEIKILEKEKEVSSYLLQLKNQQIEKQQLEDEKKSQQLALVSQQNEINKLDAGQKSLTLDNVKKENEQRQAQLKLLEQEAAYQKLLLAKQDQQKKVIYTGIAVALLLIAGGFYWYIRRKKLQNRQEVLNERLRISRELHDEVGATLSGVALFSEIAKQKMEERKEADATIYLSHISTNSKEMVEKMSDIVWAINPENDSFDRIVAKLQSYTLNVCAGKGINPHFKTDDSLRNHYASVEVKRNLYLFIKEAINNAVKYSEGKNIFLTLQKENNLVAVEIKDDGKGFDKNAGYEGNGINNMKARAESINGKLSIKSGKGAGTNIRLQFDFHPAGGQGQTV
jgi:signal transduction histidine kinase